jgi:2-(1,2-epoxy-1,2-dihydrophenyl)acetyl-CoA isomerase
MAYETLLYEKGDDGIAVLTFNRPEKMNAVNHVMNRELRLVVADAQSDDAVRAVIVTGAGRGFNAGDDVGQMFLNENRGDLTLRRNIQNAMGTFPGWHLDDLWKPTVAAVNGAAVGLGMQIALCCDVRIASDAARFGYLFVQRGIIGRPVSPLMLINTVGVSKALELMMTGEIIDAAEAARIGLVSSVVPQANLLDAARATARKFLMGAPLAQQAIKRSIYTALSDPTRLAPLMGQLQGMLFQTSDHREGARAFSEKRKPEFRGM